MQQELKRDDGDFNEEGDGRDGGKCEYLGHLKKIDSIGLDVL